MPLKNIFGFTVIELMITVALAAVILTFGVPAFQGLMERNQLASNINSFISSLALARSEAVKRKQTIAVCATIINTLDCRTDNGGYESGWMVFVESVNVNGVRDNDEEILWVHEALDNNLTLRGNSNFQNNIQYASSGRSTNAGSVALCKDNAVNKARLIIINTAGRVRLAKHNASNVPVNGDDELSGCAPLVLS